MKTATDLKNCCPYCLEQTDAVFYFGDHPRLPSPRDISVCAHCGEWSIFGYDLRLREPTTLELAEISRYRVLPRLVNARKSVRQLRLEAFCPEI